MILMTLDVGKTDETDKVFCSVSHTLPNDAEGSVAFSATRALCAHFLQSTVWLFSES